jgi:hypothetical protein
MEILVGTNSPITHRVFWKGETVDADFLPTVKIYDVTEDPAVTPAINPGTLITTITSEKRETDNGVYVAYLPLELTDRDKQLKVVWEYVVDGSPVTKEHKLFVQTPYTDLTQAAEVLGVGADYSDPNNKTFFDLLEAERYARKLIENYTVQQFYLYDDVAVVYGAGTDILPLPYKLSQLHELHSNDILLVDAINNINNLGYDIVVSESGFGIRINRANMLDNTVYVANGMVPPTINDYAGVFAKDVTYRVSGKFGWAEVPDEVDLACIELMKDYFSKDKDWKNKYIKNISTFDWKFEYDTSIFAGTGNNYADQLLLPYVLNKMVVI